ncbi:MAG: hypothetical protein SOT28_00900 [Fusicatenibacter sp.]|nr:hypothetical protein [Fusicatenibacter sp.]
MFRTLLIISGILTVICVKIAYGGVLFAAAACMFSAARSVRIAENKNEHKCRNSESGHEPEESHEG